MKNQIPQFLQEQFKLRTPQYKKFSPEIKQFMIDYSTHYEWELSKLNLIFKLMKQGVSELDECEYTGCTNKKKVIWDGTITRGCCKNHNTKIMKLEKYGVEHEMQLEENKRYGNDNIFSNGEYIQKKFKEKYGVSNPQQVKEIQDKIKKTNLEKYGCEWNIASTTSREKQNKTNIEKYGVENYAQSQEFKERKIEIRNKVEQKSLEKYGTTHPMKSTQCKEKYKTTSLKNNGVEWVGVLSKYETKEYIWQTGEISKVQGYENIVLSELEKLGYTYKDLRIGFTDVPSIQYFYDNKQRTYYPDIYIPKENLIIEVKSEYTLNKELAKNQAKFKAVKAAGYEFRLEVR